MPYFRKYIIGFILTFALSLIGHTQIGVQYKIQIDTLGHITTFSTIQKKIVKVTPILPKFDANHLPMFCKMEYNMEKKTRFPVRFRLGTLDIVDKLEGKR